MVGQFGSEGLDQMPKKLELVSELLEEMGEEILLRILEDLRSASAHRLRQVTSFEDNKAAIKRVRKLVIEELFPGIRERRLREKSVDQGDQCE